MGVHMSVHIYHLLADGLTPKQIAQKLGCSLSLVWKKARKYVAEGKLARISKYPARWTATSKIYTHHKPVGDMHPITPLKPPINIPCKFGAQFIQIGKPPLNYTKNGKAYDFQPTHTAIFGRNKCIIWLKAGFRGETPDEIIKNANEMIKLIANDYSARFGITLTYQHTYLDIEWVMQYLALGKTLSEYEGIKLGEKKLIAGAYHKYGDASHPFARQYQAAPNHDQTAPTEHARIDHYIYSGGLNKDLYAIKEVLIELQNIVIQIRQRLDSEVKK